MQDCIDYSTLGCTYLPDCSDWKILKVMILLPTISVSPTIRKIRTDVSTFLKPILHNYQLVLSYTGPSFAFN